MTLQEKNRLKQQRWRANNRERNRESERLRYAADPQRGITKMQRMKRLYPEKYRARYTLNNAVAASKITRPTRCKNCLVPCIPHGHHKDYSKPLEVEWLCSLCHGRGWRL